MIEYHTLNDLIELSAEKDLEVWEIIQQADMYENDRTESDSFNMMRDMYDAMKNADSMYDGALRSASKKAGGDGELLHAYNESGKNICGSFMGKVMEKAIKMGEKLVPNGNDNSNSVEITNYMNSLVERVIQNCAGIEEGDFEQIFKEIRQELFK